eukprot:GHRQ01036800.1.p1 GENE.GHRQ01036800.1~~GHRQ01036800.1.p1  ORF type:complete len:109 (+),score=2.19 GHRQ01036800.1:187-513(+)
MEPAKMMRSAQPAQVVRTDMQLTTRKSKKQALQMRSTTRTKQEPNPLKQTHLLTQSPPGHMRSGPTPISCGLAGPCKWNPSGASCAPAWRRRFCSFLFTCSIREHTHV